MDKATRINAIMGKPENKLFKRIKTVLNVLELVAELCCFIME